jgi:hypothetical protein
MVAVGYQYYHSFDINWLSVMAWVEIMTFEEIAEKLSPVFKENDWVWSGFTSPPDAKMLVELMEELSAKLDSEPSGTTIELGRVMVRKEDDDRRLIYLAFGVI